MDFRDLTYLLYGTERQQKVFTLLREMSLFRILRDFDPILCGTIPLGIDTEKSDLDIVLRVRSFPDLEALAKRYFSDSEQFGIKRVEKRGRPAIIISFVEEGERIQLFGMNKPSLEQYAYRHMQQEYRLLQAGGSALKERILDLKRAGLNTEEAFCSILDLDGDPFEKILELEGYKDHEVSSVVANVLHEVQVRRICPEDDLVLGEIIRNSFLDYQAKQEGTVFSDSVIDRLSESFDRDRSAYFVLEGPEGILGGAGIQPLKAGPEDVCELQKMYIRKEARGKRLGKTLLDHCLNFARKEGFTKCYLESLPELKDALKMYEAAGFSYIPERMGATGYYGCSLYMLLLLDSD